MSSLLCRTIRLAPASYSPAVRSGKMARCPSPQLFSILTISVAILVGGWGCGKKPPPSVDITTGVAPAPTVSKGNAFDAYIRGADLVEATKSPLLERTFLYAKQRRDLVRLCEPANQLVMQTTSAAVFPYAPHGPFDSMPHGQGWRLMGLAFSISIDEYLRAEDYVNAVSRAIAGTRFGLDLCGGGAIEADLGMQIVDDCRRAILQGFEKIPADQLRRLGRGVKAAWAARPNISTVIDHEAVQMESCIVAVEMGIQRKNLAGFDQRLGKSATDVSAYLTSASASDQEKFVVGLRQEMRERLDRVRRLSGLTLTERQKQKFPDFAKGRPWRRYAWHYLMTLDPILPIWDATTARTCMLILACELEARRRERQAPPRSLAEFSAELTRDPYTGQTFIYRASEASYALYSVGEDLIDNGGPSRGAYSRPDLGLEREDD
jgi:hypothetical protein